MHKILINGEWVDALSGISRQIRNPATLELLGTAQDCFARSVPEFAPASTRWRR